jgi:lipooligosaccharide transport system permease protein
MVRVVEREFHVYRRMWRGLVFSTFLSPILFLAAMGVGLGGLIDDSSGGVEGMSYIDFVAPGLLVAASAQIAAAEAMWPVVAGVKWMRFYHGIVATPIRAADVFGGFVLWQTIRTMFSASVFLVVAALLGGIPSAWGILAIPAAALTAAAFASPLAAFSISQETDLSFPLIMRLGIVPLFLFSGTFFPISELPAALQPLAVLSPLWHGIELARRATTADWAFLPVIAHVAYLALIVAIGWRAGTRSFTKRLAT